MRNCLWLVVLIVGCAGESSLAKMTVPQPDAVSVPFQAVDGFSDTVLGGIVDRRRLVIRSAAVWESFWQEFTSTLVPAPEIPLVHFTSHMVIVASMGRQPTGGYTIAIEDISHGVGVFTVRVLENIPGPTCLVSQGFTAPITAVVLAALPASSTFVEREEIKECSY